MITPAVDKLAGSRPLPALSLRLRIALTILCLEMVLVGGVLFVTLRESLTTTTTQLAVADRDTTALLQDLGRIALLTDEFGNLQSFVETLDQSSRIRSVRVIDASGRIMASSEPSQIGTRPVHRDDIPTSIDDVTEIANGAYRLGWLQVSYSNEGLEFAHQDAYRFGLSMAAAGILVIALVSWSIGHLLTRKLAKLATVADAVSGGNLTLRARLRGRDEVARVGRAFDDMVDQLEQRLEAIRLDRDRLILPTEAIHEGFVLWHPDGRLDRFNKRFCELLGAAGAGVALGMTYEAFTTGPFADAVGEGYVARSLDSENDLGRDWRDCGMSEFGLRDGRWLRVSDSRLPDGSVVGIYTDITDAKTRELALTESEQQLRAIMDSVAEGILVLDPTMRVQVANATAAAIFGRAPSSMIGLHADELLQGASELSSAPAPGVGTEVMAFRGDGGRFPAEMSLRVLSGSSGVRIATIRDVTLQKADRDHMLLQATHDELTGLPNRRLFDDRLDTTLRRAGRNGELVGVAFLDVDRFKTVNDSLGHGVGDRLLEELSRRLLSSLRDSDTVARMGGDEFIFILPGLARPEDAVMPVRKLLEAVRVPVRIDEQELFVTASIGVAVFPTDGQERDLLLRRADAALYRAKARGRNRFELFDHALAAQAGARVRLEADLRKASQQNELSLVYQPQINVKTGETVGFEALMRWHHPQLGPVSPCTFIPIAEETGLISSLGAWALERACCQMVAWDRCGIGPLRIAVNVSPRQLQHDDLVGHVEQALTDSGLAAERLELEFTETALLLEDDAIAGAIERLRALGITLALDDFGTGYSSLSHLRQYPIQRLKMDRSFVRGINDDRGDAAVARAIIELARELGLAVVAEGVETAEQLALLDSFGCEEAQGYYLGRPMQASEVARAIRIAA